MKKYAFFFLVYILSAATVSAAGDFGVQAGLTSGTTITSGSATTLAFTSTYDAGSNLSGGVVTVPTTGLYLINFQPSIGSGGVTTTNYLYRPVINGSTTAAAQECLQAFNSGTTGTNTCMWQILLTAGDTVTISARSAPTGANFVLNTNSRFAMSFQQISTDPGGGGTFDGVVTFGDSTFQNFNWYFLILIFLLCCAFMINFFKK